MASTETTNLHNKLFTSMILDYFCPLKFVLMAENSRVGSNTAKCLNNINSTI